MSGVTQLAALYERRAALRTRPGGPRTLYSKAERSREVTKVLDTFVSGESGIHLIRPRLQP